MMRTPNIVTVTFVFAISLCCGACRDKQAGPIIEAPPADTAYPFTVVFGENHSGKIGPVAISIDGRQFYKGTPIWASPLTGQPETVITNGAGTASAVLTVSIPVLNLLTNQILNLSTNQEINLLLKGQSLTIDQMDPSRPKGYD